MDILQSIYDPIRNEYAVEIELQELLYTKINAPNFQISFISFIQQNYDYLNNEQNIIPIAYQIVIASLYRPNNSKQLVKCAKSFISALPTFHNFFGNQLFDILTKYLKNIKYYPSVSPLIFFMRRIFEEKIVSIENIVIFMNSIKNEFDNREIVFLLFVVFAPEIEEFDIDSYDSFHDIVEELSFALTSDDEYQVSDEGHVYHPFRAFLLNFCENSRQMDSEEEDDSIEGINNTDKWAKLKESVSAESDKTFPLFEAIKDDDVNYLQNIISTTVDFNVNQTVPKTVFEPNPSANQGCSLIEYSALFGAVKCFKALLLNHARLPITSHILAIIGGNFEIIHLIEQQVELKPAKTKSDTDTNQQPLKPFFQDALHYASLFHQNLIFQWLVETKDKSLYEYDYRGCSVIANAASSNNIECLLYILEHNLDPNYPDNIINFETDNPKTALIHACENGCFDICKILLSRKSTIINFKQYSPIHAALRYCHFNIVHLLCQRNDINLNITDENGSTPLHLAIMNNDVETAKMIILAKAVIKNAGEQYKVDINIKNKISY